MRIHRIQIINFRNFRNLQVILDQHAVIVGENRVGKSNLLYALRLVLDPALSDSARLLQQSDFCDERPRPLTVDDVITVSVDLTDFEDNEDLLAILGEHLIQAVPMVARLTYRFQTLPGVTQPTRDADYEFLVYGGDRPENRIGYDLRRRIPLDVFPALRDAEGDLAAWRRSPLRPLLERVAGRIQRQELEDIAARVKDATNAVIEHEQVKQLAEQISLRLAAMVGAEHAISSTLGFSPTDPERLIRAIRLFIDEGARSIGEASLGTANLLFLALKLLEQQQLYDERSRDHTFLAIEEPEAHLHPHIQRLVYRDVLHQRNVPPCHHRERDHSRTILLTTHSPYIVSVTPLRSLVLLRRGDAGSATKASSTAQLDLSAHDIADLERYLDVTRGELLFARATIFVEGEAELFILPALGQAIGRDFDELGITVCSIMGTNFFPYVKFVEQRALGIPFAVITDLDPREDGQVPYGHARVAKLVAALVDLPQGSQSDQAQLLARASEVGIFLNNHTLEVDLFHCGLHQEMCEALAELSENRALQKRARDWQDDPTSVDITRLLNDIESVGKGRFAQRLVSKIKGNHCPAYIQEAINYVASQCKTR
ncbi:MAG: AAA family ATPase [Chloroflexota bacterium]|nr:AAA family ATPase [Chloroflexota bacterium]